jgi:hypothetical protein
MLSVTNKPIMPSVITLSVVLMNVVTPFHWLLILSYQVQIL